MITVSSEMVREWDNSYVVDKLYITKEDGSMMALNRKEWEHLQEVLSGKHEKASAKLEEGEYTPKSIAVWSKRVNS
jgi:hypothetical protein